MDLVPRRLRRHRHRHDPAGFNLAATIINYRAPGMTWGRVPDLRLVDPRHGGAAHLGDADARRGAASSGSSIGPRRRRSTSTSTGGAATCGRTSSGSSATPRSTSWPCRASASSMEILPVFTRKPLFAYRVAAAGMIGVALLSFFVWQHHLFQSGINPDMRPLFMLTTELISIPTGFIFLVTLGHTVESQDQIRHANALLSRDALQLPHRWRHRRLPLGRAGQRDRARQLLRAVALPLHDHGWTDLRVLRRASTTGCPR